MLLLSSLLVQVLLKAVATVLALPSRMSLLDIILVHFLVVRVHSLHGDEALLFQGLVVGLLKSVLQGLASELGLGPGAVLVTIHDVLSMFSSLLNHLIVDGYVGHATLQLINGELLVLDCAEWLAFFDLLGQEFELDVRFGLEHL